MATLPPGIRILRRPDQGGWLAHIATAINPVLSRPVSSGHRLRSLPLRFAASLLAAGLTGLIYVSSSAVASEPVFPNDPKFDQLWALHNTGQRVNGTFGTPGSDINVTRVWQVTTGSKAMVIGLVDDGFDYTTQDLGPSAWVNPGVNNCPAGTRGYDVPSGACEPNRTLNALHGTQMAYLMGAVGNNGQGGVGVNWIVSIMGLTMSDERDAPTVVNAIDWAIRSKQAGVEVRVLNASWGWLPNSKAVADQIARAGEHGILVVTAAGNYGNKDNDVNPIYPCNFRMWNEICVAASDQNDRLWPPSHYGDETVDLAAPGVNICAGPGEGACDGSGTSDSTAFVSGAAALLASADPSLTVSQLKARILENVRPVPALSGKVRTGGVLDVHCAMTNCRAKTTSSPPPTNPPLSSGGSSSSSAGSSSSSKPAQTSGSSSSTLPNNPFLGGGLVPKDGSSIPGSKGSNPGSNNHQSSETGKGKPSSQNVLASRAEGSSENHGSKTLWIVIGAIALALVLGLTRERKTNPPQEFL